MNLDIKTFLDNLELSGKKLKSKKQVDTQNEIDTLDFYLSKLLRLVGIDRIKESLKAKELLELTDNKLKDKLENGQDITFDDDGKPHFDTEFNDLINLRKTLVEGVTSLENVLFPKKDSDPRLPINININNGTINKTENTVNNNNVQINNKLELEKKRIKLQQDEKKFRLYEVAKKIIAKEDIDENKKS